VVHGFFADIIRRIGVPDVEQRLLEAVEAELAVNVGLPTESARETTPSDPRDTRHPGALG
jgi:hypothetical protein